MEKNVLRLLLPIFLACLGYIPPPALPQISTVPQQAAAWQDLHSLIDRVVTTQLFLYDIPGATVALVGDGHVLHLNGYGYADRESRIPVSADRTLFGTGSVSKLFTWTAVMQLVEQGRLDLDRDVNDYLPELRIPATYPRPVTLTHLMTHTAGFEERAFGFYARSAADLVPLQMFLADHLPARVYPPGEVSAYSNYGAALAGHIVARASGMPFERYIETRILSPLGMSRSSFRQPLPPALAPDLATGYRGKSNLAGYGWYQARPSAALRTTATDMAQFMRAHLQQGRLGDTLILQPASSAAMQRRQFSNHPAVSGMTYGFQELQRGGQRILWQPGDTLFYTAALFLLPEPGLGLFV
ncbi:MAG: serine hydrolase domain-containing protein, partial [Pseudomonadota bacterium]|nr:serine hydrolase domain-containing protein [Pseudomonadota bacterium]